MSCEKKPFTYQGARDALLNARIGRVIRHNGKRQERRIYCCRYCGSWHLTSAPGRAEDGEVA